MITRTENMHRRSLEYTLHMHTNVNRITYFRKLKSKYFENLCERLDIINIISIIIIIITILIILL